jgi:hypothetical protein
MNTAIERSILEFADRRGNDTGWDNLWKIDGYEERTFHAEAERLWQARMLSAIKTESPFGSVLTEHISVGNLTDKGRVRLEALRIQSQ